MAKAVELQITKHKAFSLPWPRRSLQRGIGRLLEEASVPAGRYLYELLSIEGMKPVRSTQIVVDPLNREVIRLCLNLQLNGAAYMGTIRLPKDCAPEHVQSLIATAKRLDEVSWFIRPVATPGAPAGQGRRAYARQARSTLLGYVTPQFPGSLAVTETKSPRVTVLLADIDQLIVAFSSCLKELSDHSRAALRLQATRSHELLTALAMDEAIFPEDVAFARRALRDYELLFVQLQATKIARVKQELAGLHFYKRILLDGSWLRGGFDHTG